MATPSSDPAAWLWAWRPPSRLGAARVPRTVSRNWKGAGSIDSLKGSVVIEDLLIGCAWRGALGAFIRKAWRRCSRTSFVIELSSTRDGAGERQMPYTEQHKRETRKRIIQSARRLFNRHGFAEVSIDEIMAGAGLTRGGFYKHFEGKEDLYEEAVLEFICAEQPEAWQASHVDPEARGVTLSRMILDAYLSPDHFADRDGSCPL